jgi:predicted  nucleic acid-binding Zn-ribbon protein
MVFENPTDERAVAAELVKRLNEGTRRTRSLEQRIDRIESRISGMEETVIEQMNSLKIELDRIGQKIVNATQQLTAINNEILRINRELGKTATKQELKEVETFVDLVNPITAKFVTKDELERRLEDKVEELVKKS